MIIPRRIADIERMIQDQIQENIHLDYKRSAAIHNSARDEIAKDVSAFANSDKGVLLYGVEERTSFHSRLTMEWKTTNILGNG